MATIARMARQRKAQARRQQQTQRRRQRHTKRRRPRRPAPLPRGILRIAGALVNALAAAFTRPTAERFVVLLFAAILTTGCRTILNMLRTVNHLAPGHASSYHRVFSKRRWSLWRLGRALAGYLLTRWLPTGIVSLAGDDTVAEHRGKKVYGKACHRDAVRSTQSYTAYRWGHKWVVLAILVKFPFATRPWALPILVALYHSDEWNKKHGRRHKTPCQLVRQLLAVLLRWFPERRFRFTGDGNFAAHELAAFAQRQHQRLALVSKFYPDANLYAPPPALRGKRSAGRPRGKGAKLPKPEETVARTQRLQKLNVAWYGGGRRDIAVVTATGHWYKAGRGLVPVRWVYVRDRTGTHRDEYFFTTDLELTVRALVESYTGRWNIETTFQEMRSYLKLEKTRGWTEKTVLRTGPCLFGLYAVIALWYAELPARWRRQQVLTYAGKRDVTFSDAITAVRRWLWDEWVFATPEHKGAFAKIPPRLRAALLRAVAPAA
ncbi:MAG: transposase family protein [Limisphaerales bacterium]|nr:MAG: transposase family protein [Limisphaerales bacterium]